MKIDLAILVVYAAVLALVVPSSALNYAIAAALIGAGVTWLTRAKHFYLSLQWFRTHALQAVILAGLVAAFALLPFVLGPLLLHSAPLPLTELPAVLVVSPITFLWFWAFLAAGSRFQERRVNKLVERRLAERPRAEDDRGTPSDG